MAQPKGQTGNPNGRPKGSPNKVTQTAKEWIAEIVEKNMKQIEADMATLSPRERILVFERLLAYVVPKQQAIKAEVETPENPHAMTWDEFRAAMQVVTDEPNNG